MSTAVKGKQVPEAVEVKQDPVVPVKKSIEYGPDRLDDFDDPQPEQQVSEAEVEEAEVSETEREIQADETPRSDASTPPSPSPSTPPSPGSSSSQSAKAAKSVPTNGTGTAEVELDEEFEELKERKKEEKEHIIHLPGFVQSQKDGLLIVEMVANKDNMLLFATNKSKDLEESLSRGKGEKKEKIMPPLALKSFVEPGPGGARSLRLPSRVLRSSAIGKPPSEQQRANATVSLIGEIKAFIKRWADMPEEWITPIAVYVLMTWVYDKFTVVPYLRFLGEIDTGKTRIAQVAAALSYRSLTVSGNITGASLFHSIDLIRGTLFLDEADFKNSDEQSDLIKILNNGHMAGLSITRNQTEGKKWVPVQYYVYGPKIITSRKRWDDSATESRCLTFETQERRLPSHIPLQLNEKFELESLALRNKLLGWRFDNFEKIKADDSMLRKAGLKTRMAQMGTSLLAVAPESEKVAIVKFLKDYAEGAKGDSHREVVRQILEEAFAPQRDPAGDVRASFGVSDDDIFDKEGEVSIKRLTESTNQRLEGSGSNQLTHKTIGGIVRSLGYETRRKKTGYVVEKKG